MSKIIIDSLGFSYDQNVVLSNLNLKIERNGIYPLIGLNGAGKSTLVKLILGELKPTQGSILIDNENPHELSLLERASKISYLPQFDFIDPSIEVNELLQMSYFSREHRYWNLQDNRFKRLIEDFDIERFLNKKIGEVSGGERKKILLASTFLQQGAIVILDEPFASLDPKRKGEVGNLITSEKNRIVIVVTHEEKFIQSHIEKTIALKNKNLFNQGSVEDSLFLCEVYN